MYKVVIVDDEDLIRQGLITFVKWNEMGFEVVGESSDGNQAFEVIQKCKPHVVLTDIKMPRCTGIDLMKKIKSSGIDVKIVVLSGYDEFEYAKTALEVGAVDYLLKPVKHDKLKEVFLRIKEDFDTKIQEKIRIDKAIESLRSQFLIKVINGVISGRENILKQAEELNLNLNWKYYLPIIIEIDNYDKLTEKYPAGDIDSYKFTIRSTTEEICSKYGEGYSFVANKSEIVVLFESDTDEGAHIKSLVYEIKSSIDSLLESTVTVSVGDIFQDISLFHDAYTECRRRADKKFILGKNRIIFYEDTLMSNGIAAATDENIEGKLLLMIQSRDFQGLDDLVNRHFSAIQSKDIICNRFFSIIRVITKYLEKKKVNVSDYIDENKIKYSFVNSRETLSDIIAEIKTIIKDIVRNLEKKDLKDEASIISEIKEYVNKHFGEDISLEVVAQKVFMHPMYLSKMFKKETGINYIDYLTNVRVEKARQLMNDLTLKTYEISEMVGYKSPKHFSKVFRSSTGVTPKEYRKNLLGYEE